MIRRLTSRLISPLLFAAMTISTAALAQSADYPNRKEADWIAPKFTFHTGESIDNLRLHYATVGDPSQPAVLLLHGTYGSGAAFLGKDFGGLMFGPGQPLDASKHYVIMPDAIGVAKSSKPSDGLRMRFPQYNYADMVLAQYRLVTEGLGVKHLKLVMGNSMGGMQTWLWGETYPDMMDALVPMASQPVEMASRNWMMRRMLVESIKQDPAWNNGNYTTQPPSLRLANTMFGIATSGGTLAYQNQAPTRALADKIVDERLNAPVTADANDFIYQWSSSGDYNAMPNLSRIKAPLLAINSADDERNPPETGTLVEALKQLTRARLLLIPASTETRGHSTTASAKFYAPQVGEFLKQVTPR
ncbi:alpha/beta fold hydrolase [Herbaspirillum lusitanum]|uniref:Alpha/beta fold hydrolase n=1 Tax=Herbaspirillum lusitanum TaxID=213312 RepID=A0ABW9A1A2_9BURK